MIKEYVDGWVIIVGKRYIKQKGGYAKLLREAKFFKKLNRAEEWREDSGQKKCAVLPALQNTKTGNIRLKKGET